MWCATSPPLQPRPWGGQRDVSARLMHHEVQSQVGRAYRRHGGVHPDSPAAGHLDRPRLPLVMYNLLEDLSITGMSWGTLQPCAGRTASTPLKDDPAATSSSGERRSGPKSSSPSAPTAPTASASVVGFESGGEEQQGGLVDIDDLASKLSTYRRRPDAHQPQYPRPLRRTSSRSARWSIKRGTALLRWGEHERHHGDGDARDMGFDVIHLNLHKTFSTPTVVEAEQHGR